MKPLRSSTKVILGSVLSGFAVALCVGLFQGIGVLLSNFLLLFFIGMVSGLIVFGTIEMVTLIRMCLGPESKRKLRFILLTVIVVIGSCRIFIPCSVSGNWIDNDLTGHLCDAHAFIGFSNGKVTYYHDLGRPTDCGAYTKVGWNTYSWSGPDLNGGKPITVKCGWIFVKYQGFVQKPVLWGVRDFRLFDCERIIRETKAQPKKLPMKNATHE